MGCIDLTGNVYGQLTVQKRVYIPGKKPHWECLCECGKRIIASSANLKTGSTKSCGCLKSAFMREVARSRVKHDLTGKVFGRLTVVKPVRVNGRRRWYCECSCGGSKIVAVGHLMSGSVFSCGCHPKGPKKPELEGLRFGRLVVVTEVENTTYKSGSKWLMRCDCGVEKVMTTGMFVSGGTISCGCHRTELSTKRLVAYMTGRTGPLHPNWDASLTDEEREKLRRGIRHSQWAKDVKKRDDYTCQVCCQRGGVLHSHHLDSYRKHPDSRLNLDNGVTLCRDCHLEFHNLYGRKETYAWQFREYQQRYLPVHLAA